MRRSITLPLVVRATPSKVSLVNKIH